MKPEANDCVRKLINDPISFAMVRGFEKIASLDRSVEQTYMEHAYAARH